MNYFDLRVCAREPCVCVCVCNPCVFVCVGSYFSAPWHYQQAQADKPWVVLEGERDRRRVIVEGQGGEGGERYDH